MGSGLSRMATRGTVAIRPETVDRRRVEGRVAFCGSGLDSGMGRVAGGRLRTHGITRFACEKCKLVFASTFFRV